MVLICDNFIRSGFLKEECCPYCHENESFLYSDNFTIEHPANTTIKAALCCMALLKIRKLTVQDWDNILKIESKIDIIS